MARLLADEQFPRHAVELLRTFGHDVLTIQEAGKAGISDDMVLDFATLENRAVLTINRRDFFKLHQIKPEHAGIIACKDDLDWNRLATNINTVIFPESTLMGKVFRVNRFSSTTP
jgi:predicted nuclease of predicted toxin-antitoxin system